MKQSIDFSGWKRPQDPSVTLADVDKLLLGMVRQRKQAKDGDLPIIDALRALKSEDLAPQLRQVFKVYLPTAQQFERLTSFTGFADPESDTAATNLADLVTEEERESLRLALRVLQMITVARAVARQKTRLILDQRRPGQVTVGAGTPTETFISDLDGLIAGEIFGMLAIAASLRAIDDSSGNE